jgi:uncharacterized membrane protein
MAFIDKSVEVDADVRDVYALWTAYEDYPSFMVSIESVTLVPDDQLLWVADVEGETYEWDTDIVEHVDEQKIEWQAIDGREVGEVRFEKLSGGRTSVTYQLEYDPSAWDGDPTALERWMERRVTEGLETFKELAEGQAAA